jgi:23S rRNA pseudouridine1911/1915/1917 synthase
VNQGCTYVDWTEPPDQGVRVADFYAARYRHSTPDTWRERCLSGEISCDGALLSPDKPLRAGMRLQWKRPPWEEPPAPLDFPVLYEDDAMIAIDKPSGLPVLPAANYLEHTVLRLARKRWGDPPPAPVHRLGRGTSGLLLLARSETARRELTAQFRDTTLRFEGIVRKRYRAVTGPATHLPDAFEVDTPIGRLPHPRLGHVHAATPGGKPSRSHVSLVRRRADRAIWEIDLLTGRPHQIRIHLAAAGAPLLGDPFYGPGGLPREDAPDANPGDCGYLLRSCSLVVLHPNTHTPIHLAAPQLPEYR